MSPMHPALQAVKENISKAILGKSEAIDLLLIALLCEGHVLIEDVPGVGKTSLAEALAKSAGCSFRRIQFTPDVLPSDITGFTMANLKTGEFEYHPGMIMSQIILADEINRTAPKTQSSLLEVMEENQVTVDGATYLVPRPFLVLATQNPVEYIGTYPLPEAQMDRFLLRMKLGYPSLTAERELLARYAYEDPRASLQSVLTAEDILFLQEEARQVYVHPSICNYILNIVTLTREHALLNLGVSPRGSLALLKAAQGHAYLFGRDYVLPDDVQAMAEPVLAHRLILKPEAGLQDMTAERLIRNFVNQVKVPVLEG